MLIFGYEVELDAHILVTGAACASDFTRVTRCDDAKVMPQGHQRSREVGRNANDVLTLREALIGARPAALNY